ncbi:hypothetical protein EI94DRAFT_1086724 [Lactarius quietus]|nr:hypothetical protein EI94DRAFT_1086724 [Lactarius quietus]
MSSRLGSPDSRLVNPPPPLSRGRGRHYQSSGIGGMGNIRASSTSSERTRTPDGPDDFSSTRGREPRSAFGIDKVMSIGRGGAGNIRSPSQDVVRARPSELSSISEAEQVEYEKSLIRKHEAARGAQLVSGGRGGVGNMVRRDSQLQSLSRSSPGGLEAPTTSQPGHDGMNDLVFRGARTHQRAASKEDLSRTTTR